MARIDAQVLKDAIAHVNDRMKRAGSDYSYRYGTRNGFHCVDTYKGDRQLFTAGIGTARECLSGLYSDAFDRVADSYVDRLREANAEFTSGPIFYPGASIPIPSPEFVTASINVCAGIPLDALQNIDPQPVHHAVMENYHPKG